MKVISSIFFSLVFFLQTFSQEPKQVKQLLHNNNYPGFSDYIDSIKKVTRSAWTVYVDETRPLFGDISSRFLRISEITEYNGLGNINNHLIHLFTKRNEIVYYYLETDFFEHEGEKFRSRTVVDSFKNIAAYNKIFQDYLTLYQVPLVETELWSNEMVYGWSCGITGGPTEPAERILGFVKNNQIDSIRQWLRSPIPAKQLYAIKAFSMIGTSHLSKYDKQIIKIVSGKAANVAVCNGCIVSNKPIKEILSEINVYRSANTFSYFLIGIAILGAGILLVRRRRAT